MKLINTMLLSMLLGTFANAAVLTTGNTIVLRDGIDVNTVTEAQLKLAELDAIRGNSTYPLYLVLDSPGGSIMAGETFIEFASQIKNLKTITIFAASMASAIVEALPGQRIITPSGVMMFHRAAGRFQGQFEEGEVESQLYFWKAYVKRMEERNASRMKLSLEAYKSKVVNELWLTSEQSVKQNAADVVETVTCSKELINSRITVTQQSFFGSSSLILSGCPLIRGQVGE